MNIREKINDYCKSIGLDTVGFIKCRRFTELENFYKERKELGIENEFEECDIEKKINPNLYMENGKVIISIAFPYFHNMEYIDNGFSIYTRGNDYHTVVKKYLNNICEYIESLGGNAISLVDSNSLPERYIAYLSGIGFIGKNNMVITKKYGSYVFLGEIITDLDIECNDIRSFNEINKYKECKDCSICYTECPSKAINSFKRNSNICVSYFTQKKDLDVKNIKLLNGRVFGCDSCQNKCPYNEGVEFSNIEEFKPLDIMNKDIDEFVLNINNKDFKETLKKTSCGWRGKNVLKRNTLLRKKCRGDDTTNIKFDSEYLNNYNKM
ncbi:tRNA epoxyqueuosine(34) reductase QueG [Clostridium sp.]|uniref:tRNA epoxyqueuosine(34) reductase QueG n=1 Tax=Clostridium sp. TaxID=1506 RepID=UPI003F31FC32